MSDSSRPRQCIPLRERFFCDGPYYLITSASLGGSDITSAEIADIVGRGDELEVTDLLQKEICIPLFFPGDCAFDNAIAVVGDLTEQEANEWIGRISWKLSIPCGKLLIVCGGGDEDDLAAAISGEGYEGFDDYFETLDVPPGEYLVEIYAYVSSMTVDLYFRDDEPLSEWFYQTHPGVELPRWLQQFNTGRAIGELGDELVSYLIRLAPLEAEPPLPKLVSEIGWCGEFEYRRPEICPLGISRSTLLGE